MNPQPCEKYMFRAVWCQHHGQCLDHAVRQDWQNFTCSHCTHYHPLTVTPGWLRQDADRCRVLIYSLCRVRLTGKHLHKVLEILEDSRDKDYLWHLNGS